MVHHAVVAKRQELGACEQIAGVEAGRYPDGAAHCDEAARYRDPWGSKERRSYRALLPSRRSKGGSSRGGTARSRPARRGMRVEGIE